jgi:hypothetical protein
LAKKPLLPSKKKRNIISLDTDSDDEAPDPGQDDRSITRIRIPSLTPPPIVAPEALKQAMAVINDHVEQNRPQTRSLNPKTFLEEQIQNELEQEDTFDMAKYMANMNSEIAKQAEQFSRKEKVADDTTLRVYLVPHRTGEEDLPDGWETPLGLDVRSTTTFNNMRETFQNKRQYQGNIVLAWNGVRLYHGTPKDVRIKCDERIRIRPFLLLLTQMCIPRKGGRRFKRKRKELQNQSLKLLILRRKRKWLNQCRLRYISKVPERNCESKCLRYTRLFKS